MSERRHSVDDLLRRLVIDAEPSDFETAEARARLEQAFTSGVQEKTPRLRRWLPAAAAVAALAVAWVVFFGLDATSPAMAAADQVAVAIEQVRPGEGTDLAVAYSKTTAVALNIVPREGLAAVEFDRQELVYILESTFEFWFGDQGTTQISSTATGASFFTPSDESVYIEAELDVQDQIGETFTTSVVEPLEDWPSDIDLLDEAIRDLTMTESGRPQSVEYLDVALDILRHGIQPAEVRANTVRLIGALPGLEADTQLEDGSTRLFISYVEADVPKTLAFVLDADGFLRSEVIVLDEGIGSMGIPAGTAESAIAYERPVAADALGVMP